MKDYMECNCCRAVRDDIEEVYNFISNRYESLCPVCQDDLQEAESLRTNPFFNDMIEKKVKEILDNSN